MSDLESLPNLIWMTMESTRMDHTSLSEYHRDTTPELARIAEANQGLSFDKCFSHGIWSRSSIGSILTGLVPSRHRAGYDLERIPSSIETVAEKLRTRGYRTCCISTNPHLNSSTGLDSGFTDFIYLNKSTILEHVPIRVLLKYGLFSYWHSGGLTLQISNHNLGYVLNQLAIQKIKEYISADCPFFIYIHYTDPHHPYHPPPAYRMKFVDDPSIDPSEMRKLLNDMSKNHHKYIANGCEFSDREWGIIKGAYDAEIYYTDKLIGQLFDYVEGLEIRDTKFVITADHGELFGENGLLTHKIVVDDAVSNVPLVLYGFNELIKGGSEIVQHCDVMKTFLSYIGEDVSKLAGVDLSDDIRKYAFIQRGGERTINNIKKFREFNPEFDADAFAKADLTAMRGENVRFEWTKIGSKLVDPGNNCQISNQEAENKFQSIVSEWLDTTGSPIEPKDIDRGNEVDPQVTQHLSELGYL